LKKVIQVPANARCLVIDDAISRRHWFISKHRLGSHLTHLAHTPEYAIELIKNYPLDWIWLDYDLAVGIDTAPVAWFLLNSGYSARITIHSQNEFGVEVLRTLLMRSKAKIDVARYGEFEIQRSNAAGQQAVRVLEK
jgi:hypothetical protein